MRYFVLILVALLAGCASSGSNTSYKAPPVDPIDYASPHAVP